MGIVAKRQKVIPKDIMEKVWSNLTVKEWYAWIIAMGLVDRYAWIIDMELG